MTLTPWVRKFALTAHVTFSVGWLGAVAAFLALAVAGLNSQDAQTVRAAYLSMGLMGWFVIVPLSLASLLSGPTLLLMVHMQPISYMAGVAAEKTLSSGELRGLRLQLVADAGAALLVLLVATTLSVFKPQGLTRYGWRKQQEQRTVPQP